MNILLFDSHELDCAGTASVSGRRFEHLRQVLKVTVGQRLRAGIVRGATGQATVLKLDIASITLQFEANSVPPVVPDLSLVMAVPRPKALSRMVQAAASFSLRRIDIINAWRVETSYFQSHKLDPLALALDARLGCEQGGQAYVPEVVLHRYFTPFVEEVLSRSLKETTGGNLLVLHPSEPGWPSLPLEELPIGNFRGALCVVLGPDGGFIDQELASLTAVGGSLVGLGDAVLRSESALVSGLSQIALLRRLAQRADSSPLLGRAAESRV